MLAKTSKLGNIDALTCIAFEMLVLSTLCHGHKMNQDAQIKTNTQTWS